MVLAGLVIPVGLTLYLQTASAGRGYLSVAVIGLIGALIGGVTIRALMYDMGSEVDPVL